MQSSYLSPCSSTYKERNNDGTRLGMSIHDNMPMELNVREARNNRGANS
jgi:hypothetical protein